MPTDSTPADTARAVSPITRLLIANRGEIARRVMRTARELGIGTVAVHSDADADAPHIHEADMAVHLPGNSPADTYLRADLLIDAARASGADAIHPGYGFLSENADFARKVIDAGLTWVGPQPEAIEAMGSKVGSKRLMQEAGVPVFEELDPDRVTAQDLPVLVKASAGGGGRGMRVVQELAALPSELSSARAEAESAFGDPTVFCEPYRPTGHHVEVQVMADVHGTVWALGERECSIQRRHQKIVEEAPSPLVDRVPGMRERLVEAAIAAAEAVGYVGAGTVEFLADDDGSFSFLEMNTRLQVEHPVTEEVTGVDLVALQLAVAQGHRLPAEQPRGSGHAIEVRLYAEDPARDWQPQTGTLHTFEVPSVIARFTTTDRPGIRLDSGVVSGVEIGVHYDPMLAKVIASAPTREEAAGRLAAALAGARVHGVSTNRDLLVRILRHPAFLAGETDTTFLATHDLVALSRPLADRDAVGVSALAAALASSAENRRDAPVLGALPSGWRNVPSPHQRVTFGLPGGDEELEVRYAHRRSGLDAPGFEGVALVSLAPEHVVLAVEGVRLAFRVVSYPMSPYAADRLVCVDSPLGSATLTRLDRFPDPAAQAAAGSLLAPMPGSVVRVGVAVGDTVTSGQTLLWLEAMKMEHAVTAPQDGVVTDLPVVAGTQVEVGTVLAVVAADGAEPDTSIREDPQPAAPMPGPHSEESHVLR